MLVHLGILDLSASTLPNLRTKFGILTVAENLNYDPTKESDETGAAAGDKERDADLAEGPEVTEEEAYVLRAAAIDACQMIVDAVSDQGTHQLTLPLPELDAWLWSVAKEGRRFRMKLVRFRQVAPCVMY